LGFNKRERMRIEREKTARERVEEDGIVVGVFPS
jgi:hypothetical protein